MHSFEETMLQAANTDLLTHLSLKLTIVSVKIYHFLYQLSHAVKVNLKLNWRISPSALMG